MMIHSGYPVQRFPLLCHLSEPHPHIDGKGVLGAVTFPAAISQLTWPRQKYFGTIFTMTKLHDKHRKYAERTNRCSSDSKWQFIIPCPNGMARPTMSRSFHVMLHHQSIMYLR